MGLRGGARRGPMPFFFQAEDGIRDLTVTGVQTCALPIWSKPEHRANALYINNRDRTFTEAAARYGIADTSFTTHAVFLDYDRDGCLDLFLRSEERRVGKEWRSRW